jgi:hypothetical protein
MIGKTYDRVQAEKQDIAQTMFAQDKEEDNS